MSLESQPGNNRLYKKTQYISLSIIQSQTDIAHYWLLRQKRETVVHVLY